MMKRLLREMLWGAVLLLLLLPLVQVQAKSLGTLSVPVDSAQMKLQQCMTIEAQSNCLGGHLSQN